MCMSQQPRTAVVLSGYYRPDTCRDTTSFGESEDNRIALALARPYNMPVIHVIPEMDRPVCSCGQSACTVASSGQITLSGGVHQLMCSSSFGSPVFLLCLGLDTSPGGPPATTACPCPCRTPPKNPFGRRGLEDCRSLSSTLTAVFRACVPNRVDQNRVR